MVTCLAVSRDGRRALTGSGDTTVRLWDLETGRCLERFTGHTDSVRAVAFHPDGRRAVSGGQDRTLRLWNLDGAEAARVVGPFPTVVLSVDVAPDGRRSAVNVGSSMYAVGMVDLETGRPVRQFAGLNDLAHAVLFTDGGRTLVGGGFDATLRVWDVETGRCRAALTGPKAYVAACVPVPGGRSVLSASADGKLYLHDLPPP